jgi:hypothetical protein
MVDFAVGRLPVAHDGLRQTLLHSKGILHQAAGHLPDGRLRPLSVRIVSKILVVGSDHETWSAAMWPLQDLATDMAVLMPEPRRLASNQYQQLNRMLSKANQSIQW